MNYSVLKTYIDTYIKENGNKEITGDILNAVLDRMVDDLGDYRFSGVIVPSSIAPQVTDINRWFITSTNGTYVNFGDIEVLDELAIITFDGTFHKFSIMPNILANFPEVAVVGQIAVASDITGKKIKFVPVSVDDSGNVIIAGNATINGTLTTINSETLQIKDKNIELAKVVTPTDDTADGGGITLLGATNKTITWVKSKLSWVFNQAVEIAGDLNVIGTIKTNGSQISTSALSDGTNLVKGPASSTANSIPVFDGVTGKLLKNNTGVSIISGKLVMSNTSSVISTDTTDGSDNKRLLLASGGNVGDSRGGYMELYGNEFPGVEGDVRILAGDASVGTIRFYTGAASERMRIAKGGNIGIGTINPSEKLHVAGNIAVTGTVNNELLEITTGFVQKKFVKELNLLNLNEEVTLATIPSGKRAFVGNENPYINLFVHEHTGTMTGNAIVTLYFTPIGSTETNVTITVTGSSYYGNGSISQLLEPNTTVRAKVTTVAVGSTVAKLGIIGTITY